MEILGLAALIYVLWKILLWFFEPEEKENASSAALIQVENCMNCGDPFTGGPYTIRNGEYLICKKCTLTIKKSNA